MESYLFLGYNSNIDYVSNGLDILDDEWNIDVESLSPKQSDSLLYQILDDDEWKYDRAMIGSYTYKHTLIFHMRDEHDVTKIVDQTEQKSFRKIGTVNFTFSTNISELWEQAKNVILNEPGYFYVSITPSSVGGHSGYAPMVIRMLVNDGKIRKRKYSAGGQSDFGIDYKLNSKIINGDLLEVFKAIDIYAEALNKIYPEWENNLVVVIKPLDRELPTHEPIA